MDQRSEENIKPVAEAVTSFFSPRTHQIIVRA
jgi:hypothetical protein